MLVNKIFTPLYFHCVEVFTIIAFFFSNVVYFSGKKLGMMGGGLTLSEDFGVVM